MIKQSGCIEQGWNFPFLIRYCRCVCRKAGYRVREVEHESAINAAVFRASLTWRSERGRSRESWAALEALTACEGVLREFRRWRRQDNAGRERGILEQHGSPISLSDFEVLQFVAIHGRGRAAKLLAIPPRVLRELLDDIEARVKGLL